MPLYCQLITITIAHRLQALAKVNAFGKDRIYTLSIILMVLSLSVGLFSNHIYHRQKSNLVAEHQTLIRVEVELLGVVLSNFLVDGRIEAVKNSLDQWSKHHHEVVLLEVVLDKQVVFSYHAVGAAGRDYIATKQINDVGGRTINIAVAHDSHHLTTALGELRYNLLLLTIYLIAFMGLSLWFVLFRWIIKPMRLEIKRQTQVLRDMVAYTEGLFNAISTHIAILDSNGVIISTNSAWQSYAMANGYPSDPAMIDQAYFDKATTLYQVPEYRNAWEKGILEVASGTRANYVCEYGCKDQDRSRWFIMRALPVPASIPPLIIVTHEDVTIIKESQLAFVESEGRLRQINRVYQALSTCNMLLSKAKEEEEMLRGVTDIIYNNCDHLSVWIGYAVDNKGKDVKPVAFRGHDQAYMEQLRIVWSSCDSGLGPVGTCIRERHPVIVTDVQQYLTASWLDLAIIEGFQSCAVFPLLHDEVCLGAIAIHAAHSNAFSAQEIHLFAELAANLAFGILAIRNRLAKEEALRALDRLSSTDKLTQLYNRTKLDEILETECLRIKRYNDYVFAVILLDIDHFKQVNDTHGHLAGDRTLVHFAKILQANLRQSDVAGRWGGEEFLIICPHTNGTGARFLAEKLRTVIAANIIDHVGVVTASFGVTQFTNADSIDSLLGRADHALYSAKNSGRNRVVVE